MTAPEPDGVGTGGEGQRAFAPTELPERWRTRWWSSPISLIISCPVGLVTGHR